MKQFLLGMQFLLQGYRDLFHPRVRHYVYIPILINIIVFSILFYFAFQYTLSKLSFLTLANLPSWLAWLGSIVDVLHSIVVVLLFTLLFGIFSFLATLCANLFAAPFNGLLCDTFSNVLGFHSPKVSFFKLIRTTILRELRKASHTLPRALGVAILCLILHFIPPFNLLTPFIFYWFSAVTMAIQYCDYPADNFQVSFSDVLLKIKQNRSLHWGFGLSVALMSTIPIINFMVMPAAVLGATRLWHVHTKSADIHV